MHPSVHRGKSLVSKACVTLVPLLLLASPALADDAALLRCRGIAEAAARLACRRPGWTKSKVRFPAFSRAGSPIRESGLPTARFGK